jgi:hypothetical protein
MDDPGLFCVVSGAGFALASVFFDLVDRATALASRVLAAVLVLLGAGIIVAERRSRR